MHFDLCVYHLFPPAVCSGVDPRCRGGVEVCWAHQGLQKWRCLPAAAAGGWNGEDVWKSCACRLLLLSHCHSAAIFLFLHSHSYSRRHSFLSVALLTPFSILLLYTPLFPLSVTIIFPLSLLSHLSLFPSLFLCNSRALSLSFIIFHILYFSLPLSVTLLLTLLFSLSFSHSLHILFFSTLLSHLFSSLSLFSPTLVFLFLLSLWALASLPSPCCYVHLGIQHQKRMWSRHHINKKNHSQKSFYAHLRWIWLMQNRVNMQVGRWKRSCLNKFWSSEHWWCLSRTP